MKRALGAPAGKFTEIFWLVLFKISYRVAFMVLDWGPAITINEDGNPEEFEFVPCLLLPILGKVVLSRHSKKFAFVSTDGEFIVEGEFIWESTTVRSNSSEKISE